MWQRIVQKLLLLMLSVMLAILPQVASAQPLRQFAVECPGPQQTILGFPAWYRNLNCDNDGRPQITKLNEIWKIALNIIEWLILAAAYIAVGFIMWGGVKYVKSRGDPGKTNEAKMAIMQAVIGLGITLAAVAMVQFVSGLV